MTPTLDTSYVVTSEAAAPERESVALPTPEPTVRVEYPAPEIVEMEMEGL